MHKSWRNMEKTKDTAYFKGQKIMAVKSKQRQARRFFSLYINKFALSALAIVGLISLFIVFNNGESDGNEKFTRERYQFQKILRTKREAKNDLDILEANKCCDEECLRLREHFNVTKSVLNNLFSQIEKLQKELCSLKDKCFQRNQDDEYEAETVQKFNFVKPPTDFNRNYRPYGPGEEVETSQQTVLTLPENARKICFEVDGKRVCLANRNHDMRMEAPTAIGAVNPYYTPAIDAIHSPSYSAPEKNFNSMRVSNIFCSYVELPTIIKFPKVNGVSNQRSNHEIIEKDENTVRSSKISGFFHTCYDKFSSIDSSSVCDNKVDCRDGSDEMKCSCKDRISRLRHCDGFFDCPNGEDELGCNSCSLDQFNCYDQHDSYHRTCLPIEKRCDGVADCPNGKDEFDCTLLREKVGQEDPLVSYGQGFLHRNLKGKWYPVCSDESYSRFAHLACVAEFGPPNSHINLSLVIEKEYKGYFIVENSIQGVSLVGNCSGFATWVECPKPNCGMPSPQKIFDETSYKRYKRGMEKKGYTDLSSQNYARFCTSHMKSDYMEYRMMRYPRDVVSFDNRDKRNEARIVGGTKSSPGAWPWVVAIHKDGSFKCGGVIISSEIILTAAHCMKDLESSYFEIRAGVLRRFSFSPQEQVRTIKRALIHENFDSELFLNDIALIEVNKPFSFNRWVFLTCIPPQDFKRPFPDSKCITVGWGAVEEQGKDPDDLHQVELDIFETCKREEDKNANDICAGYESGGKDSCQGDSGSPLMCRAPNGQWYTAGIVSHGKGCGRAGEQGTYTRVSKYINWIHKSIEIIRSMKATANSTCPGYQCRSGLCLPQNLHCNGVVNCLYGDDEANCVNFKPVKANMTPDTKLPEIIMYNEIDTESLLRSKNTANGTETGTSEPKLQKNDEKTDLDEHSERPNVSRMPYADRRPYVSQKPAENHSETVTDAIPTQEIKYNRENQTTISKTSFPTTEPTLPTKHSERPNVSRMPYADRRPYVSQKPAENHSETVTDAIPTQEIKYNRENQTTISKTSFPTTEPTLPTKTINENKENEYSVAQKNLSRVSDQKNEAHERGKSDEKHFGNQEPSSKDQECDDLQDTDYDLPHSDDRSNNHVSTTQGSVLSKATEMTTKEVTHTISFGADGNSTKLKSESLLNTNDENSPLINIPESNSTQIIKKTVSENEVTMELPLKHDKISIKENYVRTEATTEQIKGEDMVSTAKAITTEEATTVTEILIQTNKSSRSLESESVLNITKNEGHEITSSKNHVTEPTININSTSENEVSTENTTTKEESGKTESNEVAEMIEATSTFQPENSTTIAKLSTALITSTESTTKFEPQSETIFILHERVNERKFKCKNKQMIRASLVCDGIIDCIDLSDEHQCNCKQKLKAIMPHLVCDGKIDCFDESDEIHCRDLCGKKNFYCAKSGKCINQEKRCDKINDCGSNEDEEFCYALIPEMPSRHFMEMPKNYTVPMDRGGRPILRTMGYAYHLENNTWVPYCQLSDDLSTVLEICEGLGFREGQLISGDNGLCGTPKLNCSSYFYNDEQPWRAVIQANNRPIAIGILIEPSWVLMRATPLLKKGDTINVKLGYLEVTNHLIGVREQNIGLNEEPGFTPDGETLVLSLNREATINHNVYPIGSYKMHLEREFQKTNCMAIGLDLAGNERRVRLKLMKECETGFNCFSLNDTTHSYKINTMTNGFITCESSFGATLVSMFDKFSDDMTNNCSVVKYKDFSIKHVYIDVLLKTLHKNVDKVVNDSCETIRCEWGNCLSWDQIGNGMEDCADGRDEVEYLKVRKQTHCNTSKCACAPGQFSCPKESKCLDLSKYCNGIQDCRDGSDEEGPCNSCFDFLKKISPDSICDGYINCHDRVDERNCSKNQVSYNNFFECYKSGQVVPQELVCDETDDCPDGEDEERCYGLEIQKSPNFKNIGRLTRVLNGVTIPLCHSMPPLVEDLNKICQMKGFRKSLDHSITLMNTVVVVRDLFSEIKLNSVHKVFMRGSRPYVRTKVGEKCPVLSIVCG